MDDLIEALQIFRKYLNTTYPTACRHDVLYILDINELLSEEDHNRVLELGFYWDAEEGGYYSYKFGS